MPEIFTQDWARQWCRAIEESETYRQAAAGWEGAVTVVMEPDPEMGVGQERGIFLDLADGHCRAGRLAGDAEREAAVFELRASPAVWKRVLDGEIEPIWGLMSGKIALAKGSVSKLIPFTRAAKEMVEAAARLPATYPEGWTSPETPS